MPVAAIVGAGPGMGLAIARQFAGNGYSIALLARRAEPLDALVDTLTAEGHRAEAFIADVLDRPSVTAALSSVEERLGPIDVLEYSPSSTGSGGVPPQDVTVETAQQQLEFYVHGAITAIQHVLPAMLDRGEGTIIVTTGASSVYPNSTFGSVALAAAALRNWALSLHAAVGERGVQVAHIAINAWLGNQPGAEPELVAPLYWRLHTERELAELVFAPAASPGAVS